MWVFYTESSIPLQTLITLATVPGLHPPTSGVCSTCKGSLPTGTYQLLGESAEVCTETGALAFL